MVKFLFENSADFLHHKSFTWNEIHLCHPKKSKKTEKKYYAKREREQEVRFVQKPRHKYIKKLFLNNIFRCPSEISSIEALASLVHSYCPLSVFFYLANVTGAHSETAGAFTIISQKLLQSCQLKLILEMIAKVFGLKWILRMIFQFWTIRLWRSDFWGEWMRGSDRGM